MMLKPKHRGGYGLTHTELCERTLLTLLRGLGPWKRGVFVGGGLVPKYLLQRRPPTIELARPHVGTTDVDLVLDLDIIAGIEAYRRLEDNLKAMQFERGKNDEGNPQHFSWRRRVEPGATVVVDLLCSGDIPEGGQVLPLPGERRLSALRIPGAHLVFRDSVDVEISGKLLDDQGEATETIRVAGVVPFIVLKALAYEDRIEEKDAYDLIFCLMYYGAGPKDVATEFADRLKRWQEEPLLAKALEILRRRFASDGGGRGDRKDGPVSYARFLTDSGQPDLDMRNRLDAAAVVDLFLLALDEAVAVAGPEADRSAGPAS